MPHCCVPFCLNSGFKVKRGIIDVTFHNFAQEASRKKEWLVRIRRDEGPDFQVSYFKLICWNVRKLSFAHRVVDVYGD